MFPISEFASLALLVLAFPIMHLISALESDNKWPLRGPVQTVTFLGLILTVVFVTFGYRPFFNPDQDQVAYLPLVLRSLDSSFAYADVALNSGQGLSQGYFWVLGLLAGLVGFDIALAALTVAGVAISILAVFALGKSVGISVGPPLAAFVSLVVFVTYGELGYRLALFHDRFVEVVPATFARAILIFALALLFSSRLGGFRLFGAISLFLLALAFQQPVSIFVSAVALATWASLPATKLSACEREQSPTTSNSPQLFVPVLLGAVAFLLIILREVEILEGVVEQLSVLAITLTLACIFLANGFSVVPNFSSAALKKVGARVSVAIVAIVGMLTAAVVTGGNDELADSSVGFGEQLESFDYVLANLRSDLVSVGDAPNTSLLFILLIGLAQLFVGPNLHAPKSIGILNMSVGWFFAGVCVSELFAVLPGIGGYSIWPLASSPILSVVLSAILMLHLGTKVGSKSFVTLILVLPVFRLFDADLLAFVASLVFLVSLALSSHNPLRSNRKSLP